MRCSAVAVPGMLVTQGLAGQEVPAGYESYLKVVQQTAAMLSDAEAQRLPARRPAARTWPPRTPRTRRVSRMHLLQGFQQTCSC